VKFFVDNKALGVTERWTNGPEQIDLKIANRYGLLILKNNTAIMYHKHPVRIALG